MSLRLSFPATPECSTGLSGWAIFGIVIGSVAGALLIGVAIYFLACNKKDDKGNYEVAKVSKVEIYPRESIASRQFQTFLTDSTGTSD